MNQQPTQKSLLRKDILIVCSLLAVSGVCLLCSAGAALWGLDQRNKQVSARSTADAAFAAVEAYATGTAVAQAAEQASSTATATTHPTEQAEYTFVDYFDNNEKDWLVETSNDEYMAGSIRISKGAYLWNISEVKKPFVYWSNFSKVKQIGDFEMYVDTKVVSENPGDACSGFVFRAASADWEKGAYTFSVCNDSYFSVDYYKAGDWEAISDLTFSSAIKIKEDWNRLGISARGDHFIFTINDEVVYEMSDDRLVRGGLALLIDVKETNPVAIWFDNFGFQER